MATSWITGVCWQQNRLEWTVLRRAKETWEVADAGAADLVSGAAGEAVDWAAAIKPYLKKFKGRVIVALPTERVLLRVALLPSVDALELRGMAELQTDRFSPFPVEMVATGAEVLAAAGTSSLVAMAVVRNDEVAALGQIFQAHGAPPDVVDVAALGWWWGLKTHGQLPAHGTQIILRAAPAGVEMVAVRDGSPLLFRALPGFPPEPAGPAHEEWLAACVEEVHDSLAALETEWGGSGGPTLHIYHTADWPADCAERLQKSLGIEALYRHPLDELPTVAEGIARRAATAGGGLVMDLAPDAWREADATRRTRRRLLRTATIFLVAWLLGVGGFLTLLNVQRGQLTRWQGQVAELEKPAREIRKLRAKTLEFSQYADRSHSALECLRVVATALPDGVELTKLDYRKGSSVSLRGESDQAQKVYTFIQSLEQVELFPGVKSEGINTRNTPQGERSQFGVSITLPATGGEDEP